MTAYCIRDKTKLIALLFLTPIAALVLLACAGIWTIPVFLLTQGKGLANIHIAARGYWPDKGDYAQPLAWNWAVPPTWPRTVQHFPLLLLFHFVLSIVLLAYLVALAALSYHKRNSFDFLTAIVQEGVWILFAAVILALTVLALCIADAIVWGIASPDGLKADVLGYLVVILGVLIAVGWLWVLYSARFRPDEFVGRASRANPDIYYNREPRGRGHKGQGRSPRTTVEWWKR